MRLLMGKRKKSDVIDFWIYNETFYHGITFIVGKDKSKIKERMMKKLKWKEDNPAFKNIDCSECDGEFLPLINDSSKKSWCICWIDLSTDDIDINSIIAHELFHGTCEILNNAGIKLSKETEEVYAYLLGFFINEFNKKVKKYYGRI